MAKRGDGGIFEGLIFIILLVIAIAIAIGLIIFASGLAILASGLAFGFNIIYLIFLDKIDVGQLWTFSILLSLAIFVFIFLKCKKNIKKTTIYYFVFNVIVIMINLIAVYGFHDSFSVRLLYKISGITTNVENISKSIQQPPLAKDEVIKDDLLSQKVTNFEAANNNSAESNNIDKSSDIENDKEPKLDTILPENDQSQKEKQNTDISTFLADTNYETAMQWFEKYKTAKFEGDIKAQSDNLFKSYSIFKHSAFGNDKSLLMYYLTTVYLDNHFDKDKYLELFVKKEYPLFPTLDKIEELEISEKEIVKEKLERIVQELNLENK